MKASVICFALLAVSRVALGDDAKADVSSGTDIYETDRPGEVENPFTLPPGTTELVGYVVGANSPAREDVLGAGGSAIFMDTAVRLGIASRFEGVITTDTLLAATSPQSDGAASRTGFGYVTVVAKWNFLKEGTDEVSIALAPFIRLPLDRWIGGTSRSELGLIVPFDVDLDAGWDIQGSTGVIRSPGEGVRWKTLWESQMSLERSLSEKLKTYLELQSESGDGRQAWSTEFGITYRIASRVLLDLGGSVGIGHCSRGRMGYAGLGWPY